MGEPAGRRARDRGRPVAARAHHDSFDVDAHRHPQRLPAAFPDGAGGDALRARAERRKRRADRELEEWIDTELDFYVKGLINDRDLAILRKNLINIAQAERRRWR